MENKGKKMSLLTMGIFLILNFGMGILFEYVFKIRFGFYKFPLVVSGMIALLIVCIPYKSINMDRKIVDKSIMQMMLILIETGIFVGVVGTQSAECVADLMFSVVPLKYTLVVIFVAACLVSIAIGNSTVTITLVAPIGIFVADAAALSIPLAMGAVAGGAMFGDNLSFVSNTTIAACTGQGCRVKDKFKQNLLIALPAAIVMLIILLLASGKDVYGSLSDMPTYNLLLILPYVIVLIGGIIGINLAVVLLIGIISGVVIGLVTENFAAIEIVQNMGNGASEMYELVIAILLVAVIWALIREYGGFDVLLNWLCKLLKGQRSGLIGMGILVMLIDVMTANSALAISIVNPVAKDISTRYDIEATKTASILDIFACIAQCIIPYGIQMATLISESRLRIGRVPLSCYMGCMIYPCLLLISTCIYIILAKKKVN